MESAIPYQVHQIAGTIFARETGASVPYAHGVASFPDVFRKLDMRDVLDAISLVYAAIQHRDLHGVLRDPAVSARNWKEFVARAMREENIGYCVDDECVVHYHVDEEFERSRSATVAVLSLPKFANALSAHEDAYGHLDRTPPDTKAAVRSIFEAVEVIAKLILPSAQNLNKKMASDALKVACKAVAAQDVTEQACLDQMFLSLGEWINGVHLYRHGQGSHEPVAPSEELAIHTLSTGSAFARTLAVYAARMT
jgi:hypothetical protein